MARIVGMCSPWGLRVYAIRTFLARPWVKAYLRNPHFLQVWRFLDIDAHRSLSCRVSDNDARARGKWKCPPLADSAS